MKTEKYTQSDRIARFRRTLASFELERVIRGSYFCVNNSHGDVCAWLVDGGVKTGGFWRRNSFH